jgi:hypothetical protein
MYILGCLGETTSMDSRRLELFKFLVIVDYFFFHSKVFIGFQLAVVGAFSVIYLPDYLPIILIQVRYVLHCNRPCVNIIVQK